MINRRLFRLAREVWWPLVWSAVAVAVLTATYLATAVALAMAFTTIASGGYGQAAWWLVGAAVSVVARFAVHQWKSGVAVVAGMRVRQILRTRLLRHINALGPAWAGRQRLGGVASTVSDGVDTLDPYYSVYLPQLVVTCVWPFGVCVAVAALHGGAGLILAVGIVVALVVPRVKDRALGRSGSSRWEAFFALSSDYLEALRAMPTLRSLGAAGRRRDGLQDRSDALYRATMRQLKTSLLENGVTAGIAVAGTSFAVCAAALGVRDGSTPPWVVFWVLLLSVECFRPVKDLTKAWHSGYLGITVIDSVAEILEAEPASASRGTVDGVSVWPARDAHLENVTFTYPGADAPALRDVCVTFPAGSITALVGPSGSGKTTLSRMLTGELAPTEGTVRYGAQDVTVFAPPVWSRLTAVVPQHPYLFAWSLRDNLRLGAPDATDEQVVAAVEAAGAGDVVAQFDDGLDAVMSENAQNLSGGQRQRLAVARALLQQCPVLVLDEPTSHVDVAADEHVGRSLRGISADHTTVMIAHRLSSVMDADQIVVMSGGRVVQVGAPEVLLAEQGVFAQLWEDQETGRQSPPDGTVSVVEQGVS